MMNGAVFRAFRVSTKVKSALSAQLDLWQQDCVVIYFFWEMQCLLHAPSQIQVLVMVENEINYIAVDVCAV